jgi:hypothetical protein
MTRHVLAVVAVTALAGLAPVPAGAVTILDSTWRANRN